MKEMKVFLAITSCLAIILCGVKSPVSAKEGVVEYLVSQKNFKIREKNAYNEMVKKYEGNITTYSSTDYEYKYEKVETKITKLSAYKNCFGQPNGGTKFNSKGSGFYWADSSKTAGTFSMSVSFPAGPVNVGLSYAPGTTKTSKTSYFTAISSNQVKKYVKLQCARKYSVSHYRVYRKVRSATKWNFLKNEYPSTTYSQAFKVVTV